MRKSIPDNPGIGNGAPSGESLSTSPPDAARMAIGANQKLVHELQAHQIELKSQNEELLRTETDLAQSRDRFNDLYDFAPVGYLTLDKGALVVLAANLTVAAMIEVERKNLVGHKFTRFVARQAQDALYLPSAKSSRQRPKANV
jgi:PAS domain-containing protein